MAHAEISPSAMACTMVCAGGSRSNSSVWPRAALGRELVVSGMKATNRSGFHRLSLTYHCLCASRYESHQPKWVAELPEAQRDVLVQSTLPLGWFNRNSDATGPMAPES